MHKKEVVAVLVIVIGVAGFLVYTALRTIEQVLSFQSSTLSTAQIVDMSSWQTYTNSQYGFSVQYPQNWQLQEGDPSGAGPVAELGNPIDGTSTYVIDISVENNSSSLSSGEYVHDFLEAAKAQDQANASSGPAPQLAPQFAKSFITNVGGQDAYELYDVFEYDHSSERIYVADGSSVIVFDFPVGEKNPNIFSPANNNGIAHQIVNTLTVSY